MYVNAYQIQRASLLAKDLEILCHGSLSRVAGYWLANEDKERERPACLLFVGAVSSTNVLLEIITSCIGPVHLCCILDEALGLWGV